jgi:hypothetical protein
MNEVNGYLETMPAQSFNLLISQLPDNERIIRIGMKLRLTDASELFQGRLFNCNLVGLSERPEFCSASKCSQLR